MKKTSFLTQPLAIGAAAIAAVTVAFNFVAAAQDNPFGSGEQVFNISERIELDGWTKGAAAFVLHNNFKSVTVTNGQFRDGVGFDYEPMAIKTLGQSEIDRTENWVELAGLPAAEELLEKSRWSGDTFCYGEGTRRCPLDIVWLESSEGTSATFVQVHFAKGHWGLVEKSLLEATLEGAAE